MFTFHSGPSFSSLSTEHAARGRVVRHGQNWKGGSRLPGQVFQALGIKRDHNASEVRWQRGLRSAGYNAGLALTGQAGRGLTTCSGRDALPTRRSIQATSICPGSRGWSSPAPTHGSGGPGRSLPASYRYLRWRACWSAVPIFQAREQRAGHLDAVREKLAEQLSRGHVFPLGGLGARPAPAGSTTWVRSRRVDMTLSATTGI